MTDINNATENLESPEQDLDPQNTQDFQQEDIADTSVDTQEQQEEAKPKTTREAIEAAIKKAEDEATGTKPEVKQEAKPQAEPRKDPTTASTQRQKEFNAGGTMPVEVREQFNNLPPEYKALRDHINKREHDIQRTMTETAQQRKLAENFMQAAQPYEAHFRSMNVHPVAAAQELFNAGYVLHTGTPEQKAKLIAQYISNFKPDIDTLNNILEGTMPQQSPQESALRKELNDLRSQVQQQQQAGQAQNKAQLDRTLDDFLNNPKNEFINDVYGHMVALLNQDLATDLQDAYDQACHANPQVRKVLDQRSQAAAARNRAAAANLGNKGPRSPMSMNATEHKGKSTRQILEALIPEDRSRL